MDQPTLVGSMNDWELRGRYRFARHAGGRHTLLLELEAGTHEFRIAMGPAAPEGQYGAEGSAADVPLRNRVGLKQGGGNLSLQLAQSGIYFLSLDAAQPDAAPTLCIEPKFERATEQLPGDARGLALDHFLELELPVSFEIGRASLPIREAAALGQGALIELDRLEGEPVNIYVGGRHVAIGEPVIINDGEEFGVRILEILPPH